MWWNPTCKWQYAWAAPTENGILWKRKWCDWVWVDVNKSFWMEAGGLALWNGTIKCRGDFGKKNARIRVEIE